MSLTNQVGVFNVTGNRVFQLKHFCFAFEAIKLDFFTSTDLKNQLLAFQNVAEDCTKLWIAELLDQVIEFRRSNCNKYSVEFHFVNKTLSL